MTWHIPAWYRGAFSKTPYSAFDRWQVWPRVLLYGLYTPQAIGLLALCFISPERISNWMLWLRDWAGPQPQYTAGLFAMGVMTFCLSGPALPSLLLAPRLKKRQLDCFRGRCLNCGEHRLSEFLDDCSGCGSQYKEQDQYRALARTRPLRRSPAGVRRLVTELRRFRRSTHIVTIIAFSTFIGRFIWGRVFEDSASPPRPATSACLLFSLLSIMASLFLFSIVSFRRTRVNLLRLKGACLTCERPLDHDEISCNHCGSSIVAQQLWVRQFLLQNSGFARPQVMKFAKKLGISPDFDLSKP